MILPNTDQYDLPQRTEFLSTNKSSITRCSCKVHFCASGHKECEAYGDQSLLCYADGNPTRTALWHDQITRTMSNYLHCQSVPCIFEPKHLFPYTGNRPDRVAHWCDYLVAFETRTCVACRDPAKSSSQKGYAADQGSVETHRKWDPISIANNIQILP